MKSLKKKFKTASFAAGVDREVIIEGAQLAGYSLEDLMKETILGMRTVADAIGLGSIKAE